MVDQLSEMSGEADLVEVMALVETLDDEQLAGLLVQAEQLLKARQASRKQEAIDEINRLATAHGLTVDIKAEDGRRKRQPRPPFYQNPENPEETWNKVGARPKWFREALAAGKTMREMEIPGKQV